MIRGEHLHSEVNKLTEQAKELKGFEKAMIQSQTLLLKLLLNIRQNQVAIMNAQGVELVKPKAKNEEKTQQ